MVRVAINGFGRIGRMILKAGIHQDGIEFVAVNDLTDTETLAHLFKYDSVHGEYAGNVEAQDGALRIDGTEIKIFSEKDPKKLPWGDLNVDIVMECTGIFRTKRLCRQHIDAGAKKVLLSAPPKGEEKFEQFVMGVNDDRLTKEHDIISNGSCTTNCSAPVFKVIHDAFGIEKGYLTTTHSFTSSQNLVDGPHKDLRRARAASENIIPTTTGAANAVAEVIPELKGRIDGKALRIPTPCGSITDFTFVTNKATSTEEVNELFKEAAKNGMRGVIHYNEDPLVSRDIIGHPASAIFDAPLTQVIDGNLVKVFAWYDNEWGFSCRMIDLAKHWWRL